MVCGIQVLISGEQVACKMCLGFEQGRSCFCRHMHETFLWWVVRVLGASVCAAVSRRERLLDFRIQHLDYGYNFGQWFVISGVWLQMQRIGRDQQGKLGFICLGKLVVLQVSGFLSSRLQGPNRGWEDSMFFVSFWRRLRGLRSLGSEVSGFGSWKELLGYVLGYAVDFGSI